MSTEINEERLWAGGSFIGLSRHEPVSMILCFRYRQYSFTAYYKHATPKVGFFVIYTFLYGVYRLKDSQEP